MRQIQNVGHSRRGLDFLKSQCQNNNNINRKLEACSELKGTKETLQPKTVNELWWDPGKRNWLQKTY